MPIIDTQVRMRELGRIRMGVKGARFPTKLKTFRLTSPSKRLLEQLAAIYGGTITDWDEEKVTGKQYQLTTTTNELPVMIPPGHVGSQWYERWSADGCTRRCDGKTDTVSGKACACPADLAERAELAKKGKACKPMTRVSVILKGCEEVGLWMISSTGRNAQVEMAAIAQVCELATMQGRVIEGTLRLEERSAKKPGQARSDFVVPVLEIRHGLDKIMESLGMLDGDTFAPSLAAPPAPAALPEARPDLPPDPGFRSQGSGSVEALPLAPDPGPAPSTGDDDEVVEAEIVTDTADAEGTVEQSAAPSAGGDEILWSSDDDTWDTEQWKVEARVRGIQRRDLILKAREIAADNDLASPSTFADLTDPALAPALRTWLLTKDPV